MGWTGFGRVKGVVIIYIHASAVVAIPRCSQKNCCDPLIAFGVERAKMQSLPFNGVSISLLFARQNEITQL